MLSIHVNNDVSLFQGFVDIINVRIYIIAKWVHISIIHIHPKIMNS